MDLRNVDGSTLLKNIKFWQQENNYLVYILLPAIKSFGHFYIPQLCCKTSFHAGSITARS